ncbi:MAG: hypothetical protein ACRC2K_12475 [Clostridium sp.]
MTRDEKVKKLYFETYEEDGDGIPSLKEMEEGLQEFYSAAGFGDISIDEILKHHEVDAGFAKAMEEKINEQINRLSNFTLDFDEEAPF